jgi:hypothetical protein
MMCFLVPPHCFNNNFWALTNIPNIFPTMLPNKVQKYIKYKMFLTLILATSLMYLLMSSNIVSNTLNPQCFGASIVELMYCWNSIQCE